MGARYREQFGRISSGRDISARVGIDFRSGQLERMLDAATRRSLNYAGGYVRRAARNSIKQKGFARRIPKRASTQQNRIQQAIERPASQPGMPPFTHTGFLRDDIIYGYDPTTKSVVVGPWRVPWLNALHEFGGSQQMHVIARRNGITYLVRVGAKLRRNQRATKKRGTVTARYPARPYMHPALINSQAAIPKMWRDSLVRR